MLSLVLSSRIFIHHKSISTEVSLFMFSNGKSLGIPHLRSIMTKIYLIIVSPNIIEIAKMEKFVLYQTYIGNRHNSRQTTTIKQPCLKHLALFAILPYILFNTTLLHWIPMNRAARKINGYKRTTMLKDLCVSTSIVKVNNKSILKKFSFLMQRSFRILTFLSLYKSDTLNIFPIWCLLRLRLTMAYPTIFCKEAKRHSALVL